MDPIEETFQSPQWGSNSKVISVFVLIFAWPFQSPQWGSNSKVIYGEPTATHVGVSVPAMGK